MMSIISETRKGMVTRHKDLWFYRRTPEQMEKDHSRYEFIIQSMGCIAHTAFENIEHARRWLDTYELALTNPHTGDIINHSENIPTNVSMKAMGTYYSHMAFDLESKYEGLDGKHMLYSIDFAEGREVLHTGYALSNGDIVYAWFTKDEYGDVWKHFFNPNVPRRTFNRENFYKFAV